MSFDPAVARLFVADMSSEKAKMLAGLPYDPSDSTLTAERLRAQALCRELNALSPYETGRRTQVLNMLFGRSVTANINPPFFCDYGYNIEFGENVYLNLNCVLLDVMRITIGSNILFGPGVHIYAATHPMAHAERRTGLESGAPVTIQDDVWIGGAATICPGVTIGRCSVIGAGSVVTKDIPASVFAAGNPCRVIRALEQSKP
jgi:maltose O-acetyltransferase